MVLTELETRQIPDVYDAFESVIGGSHWRKRAASLANDIKGNKFLSRFLKQENAIAFQLEHLRQTKLKFGRIPVSEFNNSVIYPAMSFAAQSLGIIQKAPGSLGSQFVGRIRGAFKNPPDMHGLRLELSAATHFARQGRRISWPETSSRGTCDLLVEDAGATGLEIECKSISEDKGRRISRREALDFFSLVWPNISWVKNNLTTGLVAVLTVPTCLPSQYKERVELAKLLARQIFSGSDLTLADGGDIRINEFDAARSGNFDSATNPLDVRSEIDRVSGTNNREVMVIGSRAGGALVLAVQSAKDDTLMSSIFDTLSTSANRQFSGKRGAMFFVGFQGISGSQLLSIASQDQDSAQIPTALCVHVSKFLGSQNRQHIVGVGFVSESGIRSSLDGLVDFGGTAYYFPKRESPHWNEDFSGLFSWVR